MREHRHRQLPLLDRFPSFSPPLGTRCFTSHTSCGLQTPSHTRVHSLRSIRKLHSGLQTPEFLVVVWAPRLSSTSARLPSNQPTHTGMSPSVGRACQRAAADLINVAYLGVFRDVALQARQWSAPLGRGFTWRIRPDVSGHLVLGWI